ncbi:MAG: hypothetical protein AB4050_16960 [Synechococcus sp.]
MPIRRSWGSVYGFLSFLQVVLGLLVTAYGATLKADRTAFSWGVYQNLVAWLQNTAWFMLVALTLAVGLIAIIKRQLGPPWLWQTVHRYLNRLRDDVFIDGKDDPVDHHRVTLFKYSRWTPYPWVWLVARAWPWGGWLLPVERSGHLTLNTSTYFKAPDRSDDAEGVAGQAWSGQSVIFVQGLPDLANNPTVANYNVYAGETFVTVKWLKKKLPRSRLFVGMPIEVKGQPWGVVVLDSRNDSIISADLTTQKQISTFAAYVGLLLERSKS